MENNIINLKEGKALVKKYRNITIEDLREINKKVKKLHERSYTHYTMNELTGFGSTGSCTLCTYEATDNGCRRCLYIYNSKINYSGTYCVKGKFKHTYNDIENAKRLPTLLKRIKARADILEAQIKLIESESK